MLVHETPSVPRDEALLLDLEHAEGLGIRRSLRQPAAARDHAATLAPRPRVTYFFEPVRDGDNRTWHDRRPRR